MTAKEHNRLLSIFFFVQGGLQVLGGILVGLIYGGLGAFMLSSSRRDEDQMMGGIFVAMAVVVGLMVFAFAVLDLFTGWKLHKEQPIGRVLGIVASCIALLGFPLGTALGIYGLWFFLGDKGKEFYGGRGPGGYSHSPPPPPNSWQ